MQHSSGLKSVRIGKLRVFPRHIGSRRIDLQSSCLAYRKKFVQFLSANDHFPEIHQQSLSQGGPGVNFLNGYVYGHTLFADVCKNGA